MPKLNSPLMSMEARGSFGKTLIFSGWKGLKTARAQLNRKDARSAAQLTQREIVSYCIAFWKIQVIPEYVRAPLMLLLRTIRSRQSLYNFVLSSFITSAKTGKDLCYVVDNIILVNAGGVLSVASDFDVLTSGYIQYGYEARTLSYRAQVDFAPPGGGWPVFTITGLTVGKTLYWRYYSDDNSALCYSGIHQCKLSSGTSTKYLLHFDGEDGSKNIIDEAGHVPDVISVGTALSTLTQKFGPSSLSLDGLDSVPLTFPDSLDLAFGLNSWTVDFWFKSKSFDPLVFYMFVSKWAGIFGWAAVLTASGPTFLISDDVSGLVTINTANAPFDPLEWTHAAFVKNGTQIRSYVNGKTLDPSTTEALGNSDNTEPLNFGGGLGIVSNLDGYIDEFRVSKGVARWTSDFTPPSAPYTLNS